MLLDQLLNYSVGEKAHKRMLSCIVVGAAVRRSSLAIVTILLSSIITGRLWLNFCLACFRCLLYHLHRIVCDMQCDCENVVH